MHCGFVFVQPCWTYKRSFFKTVEKVLWFNSGVILRLESNYLVKWIHSFFNHCSLFIFTTAPLTTCIWICFLWNCHFSGVCMWEFPLLFCLVCLRFHTSERNVLQPLLLHTLLSYIILSISRVQVLVILMCHPHTHRSREWTYKEQHLEPIRLYFL